MRYFKFLNPELGFVKIIRENVGFKGLINIMIVKNSQNLGASIELAILSFEISTSDSNLSIQNTPKYHVSST